MNNRHLFYWKTLLSLILLFPLGLRGQGINSAWIIPASPMTSDTVRLVAGVWLPSGTCWLAQSVVSAAGSQITVNGLYDSGLLTVICYSQDTFTLGVFHDPGTYYCHFYLYHPSNSLAWDDTATVAFTIGSGTGIPEQVDQPVIRLGGGGDIPAFIAWSLQDGEKACAAVAYTIEGRAISAGPANGESSGQIILPSGLPCGIVICRIITENGRHYARKLAYPGE